MTKEYDNSDIIALSNKLDAIALKMNEYQIDIDRIVNKQFNLDSAINIVSQSCDDAMDMGNQAIELAANVQSIINQSTGSTGLSLIHLGGRLIFQLDRFYEAFDLYDVTTETVKIRSGLFRYDNGPLAPTNGTASFDYDISISEDTYLFLKVTTDIVSPTCTLESGTSIPTDTIYVRYFPLWHIIWTGGQIDRILTKDLRDSYRDSIWLDTSIYNPTCYSLSRIEASGICQLYEFNSPTASFTPSSYTDKVVMRCEQNGKYYIRYISLEHFVDTTITKQVVYADIDAWLAAQTEGGALDTWIAYHHGHHEHNEFMYDDHDSTNEDGRPGYWLTGGDYTRCYGTSIGKSNGTEVAIIFGHDNLLCGNWYCGAIFETYTRFACNAQQGATLNHPVYEEPSFYGGILIEGHGLSFRQMKDLTEDDYVLTAM